MRQPDMGKERKMSSFVVGVIRRVRQGINRNGAGHVLAVGTKSVFRLLCHPLRTIRVTAREQVAPDAQNPDDELYLKTAVSLSDLTTALSDIRSSNWAHGFHYMPSVPETFHGLMRRLPIAYEDYVFVDLGSGKGITLLLAASYPFKRIIGVEYCLPLHAAAEENIATYDGPEKKCNDITSICADATSFPIPREPVVLFLFNPFNAVVMEPVVENICKSLAEFPRKIFVVYSNALNANVFREYGFREELVQTDTLGSHIIFESSS